MKGDQNDGMEAGRSAIPTAYNRNAPTTTSAMTATRAHHLDRLILESLDSHSLKDTLEGLVAVSEELALRKVRRIRVRHESSHPNQE